MVCQVRPGWMNSMQPAEENIQYNKNVLSFLFRYYYIAYKALVTDTYNLRNNVQFYPAPALPIDGAANMPWKACA